MGSIGTGAVAGVGTGKDINGTPNPPAGFAWDPAYLPTHLVPVAVGGALKAPPVREPRVEMPLPPADEPPLTPAQSAAVDALAVAMLQVATSGLDAERAMLMSVERQKTAHARLETLGTVERAFLVAMAVQNGDAGE